MSGNKMKVLLQALLFISFLANASDCYGMPTGTINVTATVSANCAVSQTNDITFANYVGAQIQTQFSNTVQLTCTPGAQYYTQLDFGQNSPGGTIRRMRNGSDFLNYQIYSDAGYSQVWGITVNTNTNPVNPATAPPGAIQQAAYGEISAGQTAPTGTYTDQLTATVNFS